MDAVSLKLFIILELTLIDILHSTRATEPIATLETNDQNKACVTTYTGYKLTLNGEEIGLKGERGEVGVIGRTGPKGENGDKGISGVVGRKGLRGEIGVKGLQGDIGDTAMRGTKGDTGRTGPIGFPGRLGEQGECSCIDSEEDELSGSTEINDNFGVQDNPAMLSCRFAPLGVLTGIRYLQLADQVFTVYCNMTSKETCLHNGGRSKKINMADVTKPIWLSELGLDLKTIYNLTSEQLSWLQKQSSYVKQTLRYHCRDFVPYSEDDISSSVQLLSWNDVVVGPYPTDETPFYYYVPHEKNKCMQHSRDYHSTDIVLQSTNVNRLPIIDMQIRDIRNKYQEFFLESVELCFG